VVSKGIGLEVDADKTKSHLVYTFLYYSYSVHSQINVYITLPNKIYITLYLDDIPSDHISWRWLFFFYVSHRTKRATEFCLELLIAVQFNITILCSTYQFLNILEF